MVTQERRWWRWPVYAVVGVVVLGATALTASTAVRASAARWLLDATGTEVATEVEPSAAAGGSAGDDVQPDAGEAALIDPQRDVAACERIGAAATRYGDDEITLRGYLVELERAAGEAAEGGDVARFASASLDAITDRDADAEERARTGLAEACGLAAALTEQ